MFVVIAPGWGRATPRGPRDDSKETRSEGTAAEGSGSHRGFRWGNLKLHQSRSVLLQRSVSAWAKSKIQGKMIIYKTVLRPWRCHAEVVRGTESFSRGRRIGYIFLKFSWSFVSSGMKEEISLVFHALVFYILRLSVKVVAPPVGMYALCLLWQPFIIFPTDTKDKKTEEKESEQNDDDEEEEDDDEKEEGEKGTATRATTRSASRLEAER